MKTLRLILPLAATALAFASTALYAGPGPQFWNRPSPTSSAPKAPAKAGMACPACTTTSITRFQSASPNGRPPMQSVTVGARHACSSCVGAITVVKAQVTDAMQRSCPICAQATACCATPNVAQKS